MIKILLVEDDKNISKIVKTYLEKEGFSVDCAYDGLEAQSLFNNNIYKLVILDRMLPFTSGSELIKIFRAKDKNILVLMLTALVEDEDIIDGFKLGADDYVTKPFKARILIERIKALIRRENINSNILYFDDLGLSIDMENKTVKIYEKTVDLTTNEFNVLKVLYSNPGKVFTREEIIEIGFGDEFSAYDRAIDTYIKNLRKKLETDTKKPQIIKTIYGLGYKSGV